MTQALVRSPIACRAADALQIRNKTCLANSPILKGSFEFTYQLVTSYMFNSFYRTSLCNMFVTFLWLWDTLGTCFQALSGVCQGTGLHQRPWSASTTAQSPALAPTAPLQPGHVPPVSLRQPQDLDAICDEEFLKQSLWKIIADLE